MKEIAYSCPEYTIYYEYLDNVIFAHSDVHKWNKTIRNRYIKDCYSLFSNSEKPVLIAVNRNNIKLIKFGFLVGFVPFAENMQIASGEIVDFYIWSEV